MHLLKERWHCIDLSLTGQILLFVCPEFSVIIEMTDHFFSCTTGKEFVRTTLKALEIVRTAFKRMSHFFTDDNLITTLCLVHIQLQFSMASFLIDIKSSKSSSG